MMIRFLMSFVSIDLTSLMNMTVVPVLPKGQDGTVEIGGINSHTFAKDGGTSYLGRHPTSVFT